MKFILNLTLREIRSSWRRLLFFFLCIGIGVASIVALRSVIGNVRETVAGEARALLSADVVVESTRPWTSEQLQAIERATSNNAITGRTETVDAATMVRAPDTSEAGGAMMIELKGVESNFPLVGAWQLENGAQYDASLLNGNGAIVSRALMGRLNLKLGDKILIGTQEFQIRAVVTQEPGGGAGFTLGPRVFIKSENIERAGLTGFGSRARRRILFTTRDISATLALERRLQNEIKDNVARIRTFLDAEQRLGEQFTRAENYLSLAGLIVLVLGGVGISNVTRVLIEQKRRSIAILKCVGATGGRITTAYLVQIIILALMGSALGIMLARFALFVVERQFAASLPANMTYDLQWGAIAQGTTLGVLVALLFSALPLLGVRHIKPNMLLREADTSVRPRRFDPLRLAVGVIVGAMLVAVAAWQAGSWKVGAVFLLSLIIATGALYAIAALLVWTLGRIKRTGIKSFAVRHAVGSLGRPGNQTRTVVVATGLGVFLVIAVQLLQVNLVRELDFNANPNTPNMFLIDVQPDQADGVREFTRRYANTEANLVPTVRARITDVDGNQNIGAGEQQRERGRIGREYVVTYRPYLEPNERIVGGEFWDDKPNTSGMAEVSIEKDMVGLAGMKLGSRVTFDVLGRAIPARVTSLREVDWRNSRTGFMVVFRPGALEAAPQTLIAAVNAPEEAAARGRFTREVVNAYPNIALIDVGEILSNVRRVVGNITLGVSFVGAFIFLSGVLILIGSIAMTKFQRIYETAILRTLGAERRTLITMMLVEYGLQGLIAGLIGVLAALAMSYTVARFVLDISWTWTPAITLAGIFGSILLMMLVGIFASFDVLKRKPLSTLRAG